MSRQLIFDASALIAAAKTTVQGWLLPDDVLTYAQVVVPPTIKQETVDQGVGQGYADAHELDARITSHQISVSPISLVEPVFDRVVSAYGVERGDKEVLKLCRQTSVYEHVIVDDRLLYIILHRFEMRPWFLPDLVVEMVRQRFMPSERGEKALIALKPRYRAGFIEHSVEQLKGRV
ncbi:MAG: hypothetical protein CVU38_00120 [Chloroflexi bacterium HGW-Chloroflexi-1]|nr:MAG: hypothetical protein CVU38_00120 [Chloroflexi bacterium HGW-Chloroflexi-1]